MSRSPDTLVFNTILGQFSVRLDLENAPVTANYFRQLAADGLLDNTFLFRIVNRENNSLNPACPISVIQGGLVEDDRGNLPKIIHEGTDVTGLTHNKWAVSAARRGVGETYGSFFVVMSDAPSLDYGGQRHPDGQGFAVFGEVISGFAVLEEIFLRAEPQEYLRLKIPITKAEVE